MQVVASLRRQRLSRNAFAAALRWGAISLATLLVFPSMIRSLGAAGFGLWAVLTTPTGFANIADLGVGQTVVSLMTPDIAAAQRSVEEVESAKLLSRGASNALSGLMISLTVALVVILAGAVLSRPLAALATGSVGTPGASILLLAAFFNLACTVVANSVTAMVDSVGRSDISQAVAGVLGIVNALLLLLASLTSSGDVYRFAAVVAINGLLLLAATAIAAGFTGVIRVLKFAQCERSHFRAVLRTGAGLGSAAVVGSLVDPVLKWTLVSVVGPAVVAPYEIATRLVSTAQGLFRSLMTPLPPFIAAMAPPGSHQSRSIPPDVLLFVDSLGITTASISWPLFVALSMLSPEIIGLWLGTGAPIGTVASCTVLFGLGALGLSGVPHYQALAALGRGRILLLMQVVGFATTIAVVVIGVAWGTTYTQSVLGALASGVGAVAGSLLGIGIAKRSAGVPWKYSPRLLRAVALSMIVGLGVLIMRALGLQGLPLLVAGFIFVAALVAPTVLGSTRVTV